MRIDCRLALAAAAMWTGSARAQFAFTDTFTGTPSPLWSNLRGNWGAHDGVYDAASPTNSVSCWMPTSPTA